MRDRGKEYQNDSPRAGRMRSAFDELRDLAKGTEVFRYSFELNVPRDQNIELVEAYFDKVCEKWADQFIDTPQVTFWAETMLGVVYKAIYIVKDPMDILGKGSDFTHELSRFHFNARGK
jgi:hypothetical protein